MAKEFNMLGDTGAFGLIGQTAELDAAISRNEFENESPPAGGRWDGCRSVVFHP